MDYFELVAECSVALGGFAAVHAVLRGSTGPRGVFRAWGSVSFAFTTLLMSLVPLLISAGGDLDSAGWRVTSGFGLLICATSLLCNLWLDRQLGRAGHAAQAIVVLRFGQLLHVAAVLALVTNLLGWPLASGWAAYAGATTLVFVSGIMAIMVSFWLAMIEVLNGSEDS